MPRVVHSEFTAESPERAIKFYGDVFGWKFQGWSGGQMEYWLIDAGPASEPGINGGMFRRSPENTETVNTVGPASVDATLDAVAAAGGAVLVPKARIPGVGWFARCRETEGNVFGLMQDDPKAK